MDNMLFILVDMEFQNKRPSYFIFIAIIMDYSSNLQNVYTILVLYVGISTAALYFGLNFGQDTIYIICTCVYMFVYCINTL